MKCRQEGTHEHTCCPLGFWKRRKPVTHKKIHTQSCNILLSLPLFIPSFLSLFISFDFLFHSSFRNLSCWCCSKILLTGERGEMENPFHLLSCIILLISLSLFSWKQFDFRSQVSSSVIDLSVSLFECNLKLSLSLSLSLSPGKDLKSFRLCCFPSFTFNLPL